jgi:hypothetical protein
MSLDDLKKAAKITGAAQDGFTVCIHSYDGERGYDHCFRIDKAIGAYLVALLHAHNDSSYVPQQAAWVACSERLPTHEYSVLLFVTDCATQVAPFREIGIYNTKTGRFQINGGDDDIEVEVSHWADLPEPPGAQQCEPHESL